MITKLHFALVVTFGVTFTFGYLAGHTATPGVWVLPIFLVTGGSLYASHRLADQVQRYLKKLQSRLRYSDLGQSSPKLLHPSNWKKS